MAYQKEDLLDPTAILILSVYDYVGEIERKVGAHYKQLPPGVYMKGQLLPVLRSGQAYFTESGYSSQKPVTALDGVKEAIVDSNGVVVIPRFMMQQQKQYLQSSPTLPFQTALLLEAYARYHIALCSPHVTPGGMSGYARSVHNLFDSSFYKMIDEGYLDTAMQPFVNTLNRFMGPDVWHIYFIKLTNSDLVIEKTTDYRIVEYYKLIDPQNEGE